MPVGEYIVINHTTGDRFTDIIVSDTPPVLNDSVRAVLYPGAGGELFWERATDDKGIAGYEVTLNGQLLVTLDALSYYLPQLVPDLVFRFTVTAVDTSGQRSETYSANLGIDEEPVANPPEETLAPRLITEAVYSSTASELFWQVPAFTRDNPITSNEIRRNSQLIATLPGYSLRSYFDGDRTAGVYLCRWP